MAKTPRKSRASRSPNPSRPSASKTPPPGKKSSTSAKFPKLRDTPAWEPDAKVYLHEWPLFKEGFNEDHGLLVCSSNVNDKATNPTESVVATRIVKHISSNTMLVDHFQKWIHTGLCQDEKKRPAVWIKMPRTLATPIFNDMKDLEDLCKFADLCFGSDNKALNEEMKRLYIQAFDNGIMDKSIFHVITLPDVSTWVDDDDDEDDTKAKDWYYSNGKFNNFPDMKNQLTIEPSEHELKPVPVFREKKVKHLKSTMTVKNGYVMIQVFVEGSQRKLKVSNANEPEVEEERDYNDYMAELTQKVDNMSTEEQAFNAAQSSSASQQQGTVLPPIDEDETEEMEQDDDEVSNDQEKDDKASLGTDEDGIENDQEQGDEEVKDSSADTTSAEGNGFISGIKNKVLSGFRTSSSSSGPDEGRWPMPSTSRADTHNRGRQQSNSNSSRSDSRNRSRSRSRSRSSSRGSDSSRDAPRWSRHDKANSSEGIGKVLGDSEDDNEVNEMDTHEYFTEGVVQEGGKRLKVEKERGKTSLQAAAARNAAASTEQNAFVDGLMDMNNVDTSGL